MTNTHLTIENVEKLANMIAKAHGITIEDARDLAEFNLRYSTSYQDAAQRVAA